MSRQTRHGRYRGWSLLNLFGDPRAEETVIRLQRIARGAPRRSLGELAAIPVPTLVMVNRNDPVHPFEYGAILAKAILGARHAADVQLCIAEFLKNHRLTVS